MSYAKIDLHDYDRLKSRDLLLTQMENKNVVVTTSFWRGFVTKVFNDENDALIALTKRLGEVEFALQMTQEALEKEKSKPKSWWRK